MSTSHEMSNAGSARHLGGTPRSPTRSDSLLGQRLRELRRAREMTQKELASMVGVTGAQLHRYETGATRIAASRLMLVAEALGVRTDELMGDFAPQSHGMPAPSLSNDDIVELVQVFSSIEDRKNRCAVVAVARMFAAQHSQPSSEDIS